MNTATGVPTLRRGDMYAEKLLANTNRYRDKTVASRDIIDLGMMIGHWGAVPQAAWDKVRQAYGSSPDRAFHGAVEMVSDRAYLAQCLAKMHMTLELVEQIPAVLRGEASFAPPQPPTASTTAVIAAATRSVRAVHGSALATSIAPEKPDENCDAPAPVRLGN